MTILQIIGIVIVVVLLSLFYVILRACIIYSITRDMSPKEQEEYFKELERAENDEFLKNNRL
jgi:5-bromo-4-chloroindolyl phosphate hydrolysis protein